MKRERSSAEIRRDGWVQAILRKDGSAEMRIDLQNFLLAIKLKSYHVGKMALLRQRLIKLAGFDFTDGNTIT